MFHVKHDVIVVGAGHAGCEAAAASARLGASTALVTLAAEAVGRLSCNPAMGGIGKGHLVREVDALDGVIGRVSDLAGIQYRLLNRSRGPAVRGPRAQIDRAAYAASMQRELAGITALSIIEGEVADLVVSDGRVAGVTLADGRSIQAAAVVLTTGTFLGGVIHLGDRTWPAGRMGEAAATALATRLRALGLPLKRLKTGTPPRLAAASIDWDALVEQPGDAEPVMLSAMSVRPALEQRPCHVSATNAETHAIIRANLERSAMYGGGITGVGPRYCPSIEDKVVRFADRASHQVFLEPEGLTSHLVYPNGISTSLPQDVQIAFVRTMAGCGKAEIVQPGYAIEYDAIDARALAPSLELRALPGLFLAGQINGTTGYEEAAGQGLLAGLNAGRLAGGSDCVTMDRDTSYIGVMVDDLVSNGADEPYRMFTSRAENRLMLRADNATERLTPWGDALGLVGPARRAHHAAMVEAKAHAAEALRGLAVSPTEAAAFGVAVNRDGRRRDGFALLAHPGGGWGIVDRLAPQLAMLPRDVRDSLEADALYRTFTDRQRSIAEETRVADRLPIPPDLAEVAIPGLSNELRQKLLARRPATIGEARRISGMTPAGLALIAAHARRAALA
ncbi:tRNA uridine-5-carboxymethylaminomethyl(34) synthesis enzyme MnmG [Acuticoccus sp. I52.16.1]|uniref:tRNA uridine-5-carboxymethylaminomethyl(34) synthesis enzyme MnmG n=1 Tax=Acuticoccus sp. I52.16.1 TaxID=2928472 RepID=UPI001FCF8B64|nr:tRNA uridine-5-carboxymethylaminomethyl(34) synthesis enzyme MnmG [Acuticoccus sp. I52.16.1]UOM36470.1 tRNA uridine-5-carboxymethylaminomethyl(34) synthesis enzyme MnmG [Acuticoccus sp. I52.16.1]